MTYLTENKGPPQPTTHLGAMCGQHSVDSREGLVSMEGLNGLGDCRGRSKEDRSVELGSEDAWEVSQVDRG